MRAEIKGYDRVSLLDLAILAGGGVDCVFELATINALSITDDVIIGRNYDTNKLKQIDSEVVRILNSENMRPATAISAEDMAACPYGGIGFMGIEMDFMVS